MVMVFAWNGRARFWTIVLLAGEGGE